MRGRNSPLIVALVVMVLLFSGMFIVIGSRTVAAAQNGDYTYTISGSPANATITGYTGPGGAITIPSTLGGYPTTAISNAFSYNTNLTSVTIPSSVTTIWGGAFADCHALTSVTIPSSVTSIGEGAFTYCTQLPSVTIGSGVTSIGDDAFSGCYVLTSVTIPNSVITIGDYAFDECHLTSVTIPSSVTSIGESAFGGCQLTSVTIPSSVTSIGQQAFAGCPLTSVTIPSSVTSIGESAFEGCDNLTSINVDTNNPIYTSVDGVLYNKNVSVLIQCPEAKAGSLVIPNSVVVLTDVATMDCAN